MIDRAELWTVIGVLGAGSFALRFVFLGLIGDRQMPPWLLRHLRYTAVSMLPALVAPLVVWPGATGGQTDPLRLTVGLVALAVGYLSKSVFFAMLAGAAVMLAGGYWL
jgi:branched-subunit amino acid transport protein